MSTITAQAVKKAGYSQDIIQKASKTYFQRMRSIFNAQDQARTVRTVYQRESNVEKENLF